jgi:hypothetical protein
MATTRSQRGWVQMPGSPECGLWEPGTRFNEGVKKQSRRSHSRKVKHEQRCCCDGEG